MCMNIIITDFFSPKQNPFTPITVKKPLMAEGVELIFKYRPFLKN